VLIEFSFPGENPAPAGFGPSKKNKPQKTNGGIKKKEERGNRAQVAYSFGGPKGPEFGGHEKKGGQKPGGAWGAPQGGGRVWGPSPVGQKSFSYTKVR